MNDGDEYFYDKNEWVRVRVEDEQWVDISPSPPSERGSESTGDRKSPYSITVSALPLWKGNWLNHVGFDVAVWTWASRVVVGRWTRQSSALPEKRITSPLDHSTVNNEQAHKRNVETSLNPSELCPQAAMADSDIP